MDKKHIKKATENKELNLDFKNALLRGMENINFSAMDKAENVEQEKYIDIKQRDKKTDIMIGKEEFEGMHSLVTSLSEYMIYQYFRPVYILKKLSEGKINSFYYGFEEKQIEINSELKQEIKKILALFFGKDEQGKLVEKDIFLGVALLTQCSIFTSRDKSKKEEYAIIESLRILLGTITIGAKNAQNQICNTLTYLQSGLKFAIEKNILSSAEKAILKENNHTLTLPLDNSKGIKYNKDLSLYENFIKVRQQVENIVLDIFQTYKNEREEAEKLGKKRGEEIKKIGKKNNYGSKEIFIDIESDCAIEEDGCRVSNNYKC